MITRVKIVHIGVYQDCSTPAFYL